MLVLNAKKHNKIIVGEGANATTVMLCDVVQNADGTFTAKLGFDAPRHICIDRENVRNQRRSKVDGAVPSGNPKD